MASVSGTPKEGNAQFDVETRGPPARTNALGSASVFPPSPALLEGAQQHLMLITRSQQP